MNYSVKYILRTMLVRIRIPNILMRHPCAKRPWRTTAVVRCVLLAHTCL